MAKERPLPRETLAKNLKILMAQRGMSAPDVALAAKVDRKTINNHLNGRYDPRLTQVDAVAKVFGLTCWQLISPNLDLHNLDPYHREILDIFDGIEKSQQDGLVSLMKKMSGTYKS